MDHLLFARGIHAMHIDGASLHDIKSFTAIAFAKKIIPFVEVLWNREQGNCHDIGRGQSDEELTTSKRVFSNRLPELAGFQRHAAILSLPSESSRQKSAVYSSLRDNFGPRATNQTVAARSQISAA